MGDSSFLDANAVQDYQTQVLSWRRDPLSSYIMFTNDPARPNYLHKCATIHFITLLLVYSFFIIINITRATHILFTNTIIFWNRIKLHLRHSFFHCWERILLRGLFGLMYALSLASPKERLLTRGFGFRFPEDTLGDTDDERFSISIESCGRSLQRRREKRTRPSRRSSSNGGGFC